jgi:hypothetical protein
VNDLALQYLLKRGLSEATISALGIHWINREAAITERYGYGKQATSPDGLIVFPIELSGDRIISVARNFYSRPEAETQHLAEINQYRQSKGLEPVKRVPKYLLPTGDRAKGKLYDPYRLLAPKTDKPVLFATEDIFGVIKAADRGARVVSTFGVWLFTKEDLEDSKTQEDWQHDLKGAFPRYLSDSDGEEKPSVMAATLRTGFLTGAEIGCFPANLDRPKTDLDVWLDTNPTATEQDLAELARANTADPLTWLESTLPGLIETLKDRGYNATVASQMAGPVREAAINELLKHQSIADLRANGFYNRVLKSQGVTLENLKTKERAIKVATGESEQQRPIAELIVDLVKREADLFHDSEEIAYADFIVDNCRHTYPLRSVNFKRWVARRLHEEYDKSPNSEGFQAARNTLEAIACFDRVERKVWLRVAQEDDKLYLDLANERWQAVEIDSQGWRIVDRPTVRFIRPQTMAALPSPVEGGDLKDLQKLLGVKDDSWILLITFLLFCFTTGPTFPVLLLAASRGSGKTTIAEFLKSLIDPGKAPLIGLTADHHKISVAASRRWILGYDNVSAISPEVSDLLCRIATGFGFSTRTLFETDGETVFELARPQILTAIDHVVTRDDLSDRLLMVVLPAIEKSQRLRKGELDAKLEAIRPAVLGALLTALSKTLAALPNTPAENLPRMADFGHFAIAAAKVLGFPDSEFSRIFDLNREAARQVVLESSPLAEAIQAMARHSNFKGTPAELLTRLESYADPSVVKSRFWPKASNTLSRQLNRLKPDLEAVGIVIDGYREGDKNNTRLVEVRRVLDAF